MENKVRNVAQKPAPAKAPAAKKAVEANPDLIPHLLVVIRVRGMGKINPKRRSTMEMLNIPRTYNATIIKNDASYQGMLHEAKDYIAWGPVSKKVLHLLVSKRATVSGNRLRDIKLMAGKENELVESLASGKKLTEVGLDRTFHLTPPSGGWKGRKEIYPRGDLGSRPSMDEILVRMI